MTKSTVARVVTEMNANATRTLGDAVHRRLSGGLRLILVARIERRQLSLVRENAQPSRREESAIRAAFDVPAEARTEKDELRLVLQGVVFFVTRLTWRHESNIEIKEIDGRMVATLVTTQEEK